MFGLIINMMWGITNAEIIQTSISYSRQNYYLYHSIYQVY